jgi:TetR/AcrR family transcriptional regulator
LSGSVVIDRYHVNVENAGIERMAAGRRRQLILDAATEVFGARGYIGATTDQVARAAGISQPYVVRMFGSKERLFVEVVGRAKDALLAAFRSALDAMGEGRSPEELTHALGDAYVDLAERRGIHLSLLQAFVQGADPVVGAAAREGFLAVWRLLRQEAGFSPDAAREFIAQGMLISVLLSVRMPESAGDDPEAREMLVCTFGPKLDLVLGKPATG